MNKLIIAAASGVLLSLFIAFMIIYVTTYYYVSPTATEKIPTNRIPTKNQSAHVYFLELGNSSNPIHESVSVILSSIPSNISSNIEFTTFSPSRAQFIYNGSIDKNVFYVQPSFIQTRPNSTITFYLYFNISYYYNYNDSIYTYKVGNYITLVNVTQLNSTNGTFIKYKVVMHIGDINPNTLVLLPVYDINYLEIQYIIILVI